MDTLDKQLDSILNKYIANYNLDVLGFRESGQQTVKAKLTKLIQEARTHENQMGLTLHNAIKNGLEQESENASLTATWKANEQIISEFELRIKQLTEALKQE